MDRLVVEAAGRERGQGVPSLALEEHLGLNLHCLWYVLPFSYFQTRLNISGSIQHC